MSSKKRIEDEMFEMSGSQEPGSFSYLPLQSSRVLCTFFSYLSYVQGKNFLATTAGFFFREGELESASIHHRESLLSRKVEQPLSFPYFSFLFKVYMSTPSSN
jgi:hypothetical protein